MKLMLNEFEQIVNKEIDWAEVDSEYSDATYKNGFVAGMKHILEIIEDAERNIKDYGRSDI